MQYTNESIETLVSDYDKFKEHVEAVMHMAGMGTDDIDSFDGISGGKLHLTTSRYRCNGREIESVAIPLEWLTAEDPEVLKSKIEAKRAEDRRIAQERYQQERLVAEARQKTTDLETLAKLKAKYETTNQGDTP